MAMCRCTHWDRCRCKLSNICSIYQTCLLLESLLIQFLRKTSCLVVFHSAFFNSLQWPCAGAPIGTGAVASYPIYALFIRHVFCLNLFLYNFFERPLVLSFWILLISIACNGHVPVHPLGQVPLQVIQYMLYLSDMSFA